MENDYITTGYVARGGKNGKVTFDGEPTEQGFLTEASLNWGRSKAAAIQGLPGRFNTSAAVEVPKINREGGTIQSRPDGEYVNHCILFDIDIKTANNLFSNHH